MNLVSQYIGRAVGLYEEKQGKLGEVYVTRESWDRFEPFCQRVRSDNARAKACDNDHKARAKEAHQNTNWCRTCYAGVHNFRISTELDDMYVALLGGEYLVQDDADLLAESTRNFESFVKRFDLSREEKLELENLRGSIQGIFWKDLKKQIAQFHEILNTYLKLIREIDSLADTLVLRQTKIAHEFGTLIDPVGRRVDNLIDLVNDTRYALDRKKVRTALFGLSDEIENLRDSVATNLPEYFDLKFTPQMENIERLIWKAAGGYRSRAEARGIAIRIRTGAQDGGIREVEVSAKHILIALRNLIDNAVKYSFRGVEKRPRDIIIVGKAEVNFYEITIENFGVGIDPDETIMIFEAGVQGRRVKHEVVTGAGLGLTMVKKYIEMHHGQISVTCECKGDPNDPSPTLPFLTCFTVRLPYTFGTRVVDREIK